MNLENSLKQDVLLQLTPAKEKYDDTMTGAMDSWQFLNGDYVADATSIATTCLRLVNCAFDEGSVTIEWLDGTYTGVWAYWRDKGKVITETLPKRAVVAAIHMTRSMRLQRQTIANLKATYSTAALFGRFTLCVLSR